MVSIIDYIYNNMRTSNRPKKSYSLFGFGRSLMFLWIFDFGTNLTEIFGFDKKTKSTLESVYLLSLWNKSIAYHGALIQNISEL